MGCSPWQVGVEVTGSTHAVFSWQTKEHNLWWHCQSYTKRVTGICSTLCPKLLSMASLLQLLFLGANVTAKNVQLHSKLWPEFEKRANPKQNTVRQFCVLVYAVWRGRGVVITIIFLFYFKYKYLTKILQEMNMNENNWNHWRNHRLQFGKKKKKKKKDKPKIFIWHTRAVLGHSFLTGPSKII